LPLSSRKNESDKGKKETAMKGGKSWGSTKKKGVGRRTLSLKVKKRKGRGLLKGMEGGLRLKEKTQGDIIEKKTWRKRKKIEMILRDPGGKGESDVGKTSQHQKERSDRGGLGKKRG